MKPLAEAWRCLIGAVLLTAVTVLQSCSTSPAAPAASSSVPQSPTTPAVDQVQVSWLDKVCSADKTLQQLTFVNVPRNAPGREKVIEYLDKVQNALRSVITLFKPLSPAPVPGGDEVVTSYLRALDKASSGIEDARKAAGFVSQSTDAGLTVANLTLLSLRPAETDLRALVEKSPELARAYKLALVCQRPPFPLTTVP